MNTRNGCDFVLALWPSDSCSENDRHSIEIKYPPAIQIDEKIHHANTKFRLGAYTNHATCINRQNILIILNTWNSAEEYLRMII